MKNLPRKLKIGGIFYTIEVRDIGDEDCGKTDFKKSIIAISEDLNEEQRFVTLLHECIHCLNCQLSEEVVEPLSQGIYAILKDNNL